ncbi:MAG: endonuclease MutS2 [Campylobacterales bacterium]
METLIKQLDLTEHFDSLSAFFARPKPLALEGDTQQHLIFLQELENAELPPLPAVADLQPAIARLAKQGNAKLAELYDLVRIGRFFEGLKLRLKEGKSGEWAASIEIHKALKEIMAVFDFDGQLRPEASEELARVNEAIEAKKKQAKTQLQRLASSDKLAAYLVDRQVHFVNGEETLLVRGGFNHVLTGRVVDRTPAGFFYVAPRVLSDLRDAIEDLQAEAENVIARIERNYSEKLHPWVKFLRFIDAAFDRFDHYQARVQFARAKNLAILAPKNQSKIVLEGFCHPALHDPVPIGLDFSKPILLVTGVNAGGKTMLLKAVLSAALMARLLVPMRLNAHKSSIGRFKGIEAVIADPQNAKNDISTFAGRMQQFAALFSQSELLIGVDEIELGTDSDEAASLFKVMLERLAARGSKLLVTTHHKRLAALMAAQENVELVAALYDEARQKPTYTFLQGSIGKSYAFETAQRYGVPQTVVGEARRVHGEDKERLNDLIERSSELERDLRFKIASLNDELASLEKQKFALKEERETQEETYRSLRGKLEREYKEAIDAAKEAAKATTQADLHRSLNAAHAAKAKIETPQPKKPDEPLKAGDAVKYAGAIGVIKSIKKENAVIECEGKTLFAPLFLLKRAPQSAVPKAAAPKITVQKPQSAQVKLDLHGLRAEEALDKLDRFLSDALMAGFEEVMVYHGIGSGKLARAVREALKEHPRVAGYTDAPANMGGFGATIIKL